MMDDKPFGKFIISAGIGAAVTVAFALYGVQRLESRVGTEVSLFVSFVLIGLSVIAVGIFDDRYNSKVTIPVGMAGWVIFYVMVFVHFAQQS